MKLQKICIKCLFHKFEFVMRRFYKLSNELICKVSRDITPIPRIVWLTRENCFIESIFVKNIGSKKKVGHNWKYYNYKCHFGNAIVFCNILGNFQIFVRCNCFSAVFFTPSPEAMRRESTVLVSKLFRWPYMEFLNYKNYDEEICICI